MNTIDYRNFVRTRIDDLRIKENLSEYKLSLDLGYSRGYIQSITSGRTLPSMDAFFEICEYFNISPIDFFDPDINNVRLFNTITNDIKKLSDKDMIILSMILKRVVSKDSSD